MNKISCAYGLSAGAKGDNNDGIDSFRGAMVTENPLTNIYTENFTLGNDDAMPLRVVPAEYQLAFASPSKKR